MKKIVFIINSVRQARCLRRVEEFVNYGYDVDAYGFDREDDNRGLPDSKIKVIGVFRDGKNYFSRLKDIRDALLKNVLGKYDMENTLFYVFNLDVMLAFRSIGELRRSKYIYEVSDLAELIVPNKIVKNLLVWQNKRAMINATHNVFTSEGFCDYYSMVPKQKITVVPNRINSNIEQAQDIVRVFHSEKIKIGFLGVIRFETLLKFAKVCARHENVEFHLYGLISRGDKYALELERVAEAEKNIFLHGVFKNPGDLQSIYENIDMVLSAYPPTPGVIYAEPNKLYEAIYFRCPIIVNTDTFLAKKVKRLGVGFVIDAMDEKDIDRFLNEINAEQYLQAVNGCMAIDRDSCLNKNDDFLKFVASL